MVADRDTTAGDLFCLASDSFDESGWHFTLQMHLHTVVHYITHCVVESVGKLDSLFFHNLPADTLSAGAKVHI